MDQENSELERNVQYVVKLVSENPGEYDKFDLTKRTRLEHDEETPLGLRDAQIAIQTATEKGLIKTKDDYSFCSQLLNGDKKRYYPVQK